VGSVTRPARGKFQIPNSKLQRNLTYQIPKAAGYGSGIEASLGLGYGNLGLFSESARLARTLERFKKYCSHSEGNCREAVFLVSGFVSAQSQGFSNLLLRRSLAKNQKSSLRIGYIIF
jgi:hypothetical protein